MSRHTVTRVLVFDLTISISVKICSHTSVNTTKKRHRYILNKKLNGQRMLLYIFVDIYCFSGKPISPFAFSGTFSTDNENGIENKFKNFSLDLKSENSKPNWCIQYRNLFLCIFIVEVPMYFNING